MTRGSGSNAAVVSNAAAAAETPQPPSAYFLYTSMNEAMANVTSLDMNIAGITEMTFGGETHIMKMSGNVIQVIKSETDFDMAMYMTVNTMGMDMDTSAYFTGGVMYVETMGIKMQMPMSIEEALQQAGGVEILDFPESAVQDYTITDAAGGGKRIEFVLTSEDMQSLTEQALEGMQSMFDYMDFGGLDMDFGDIICEIVIDENNMLVYYRIVYDFMSVIEGIETGMKMDMTMTINSFDDIPAIVFPDFDGYMDFSGLIAEIS